MATVKTVEQRMEEARQSLVREDQRRRMMMKFDAGIIADKLMGKGEKK